jgi:hypothetical protein
MIAPPKTLAAVKPSRMLVRMGFIGEERIQWIVVSG